MSDADLPFLVASVQSRCDRFIFLKLVLRFTLSKMSVYFQEASQVSHIDSLLVTANNLSFADFLSDCEQLLHFLFTE